MNTNKTVSIFCAHTGYIVDSYHVKIGGESQPRNYFYVEDYQSSNDALIAARNCANELLDELNDDFTPASSGSSLRDIIGNMISIHNQQALAA